MRSPIIYVELATPDVPEESTIEDHSWMLSCASGYYDLRGYYFAAPGVQKHAKLGTLFEDVAPKDGCHFQLELGVILPDLFPNLDGKPEYTLAVSGGSTERQLCFSNVMARLRYVKNDTFLHALIPRRSLAKVRAGKAALLPPDASVELLRTFSTSRFDITGSSAEEALETWAESCIHDLVDDLNRCLKAMPFVDSAAGRVYTIAYSRASLPSFYFIIKGELDDKAGHGWISPHVGRSMLNPPDLPPDKAELLRRYVSGAEPLDDIEAILHSAQSFLDGGVTEYVLLLSVVAAEVATQRYVHKRLLSSGISKNKLDDAEKTLTYSLMLNVILSAVAPGNNKPDKGLLGKMNRARSLRNAYMHAGELPRDTSEVVRLYEDTKTFVQYLRRLEQQSAQEAVQA